MKASVVLQLNLLNGQMVKEILLDIVTFLKFILIGIIERFYQVFYNETGFAISSYSWYDDF